MRGSPPSPARENRAGTVDCRCEVAGLPSLGLLSLAEDLTGPGAGIARRDHGPSSESDIRNLIDGDHDHVPTLRPSALVPRFPGSPGGPRGPPPTPGPPP